MEHVWAVLFDIDRSTLAIAVFLVLFLYVLTATGSRIWIKIAQSKQTGKLVREELVGDPSTQEAHRAADERRVKIIDAISQFTKEDDRNVREFIEVPPSLSDELLEQGRSDARREGEVAPYWWLARFRMQLLESHYLLTERVTDLVVALLRSGRISPREYPTSIRAERVLRDAPTEKFQWRVVIETRFPDAISRWLHREDVQSWIGIGVQLSIPRDKRNDAADGGDDDLPRPAIFSNGKCKAYDDGLEGTVGGVLGLSTGEAYGLTCRHVLSSRCQSLIWPQGAVPVTGFDEQCPDAALIDLESPCFPIGLERSQRVSVAATGEIDAAVLNQTKVHKAGRESHFDGVIECGYVANFVLGDKFYRGHHFRVAPFFVKRFGIIFPLKRRFSKPGDSGAWILDEQADKWFGMVVGGYMAPNVGTIALSAAFITEAYSEYVKATLGAGHYIFSSVN